MLSVKEFAALLGLHEETIRRWLRDGEIESYRKGTTGRHRIPPSELERVRRKGHGG